MKPTYEELEAKCAALAAENAGLKDEISNITFMRDDDFWLHSASTGSYGASSQRQDPGDRRFPG